MVAAGRRLGRVRVRLRVGVGDAGRGNICRPETSAPDVAEFRGRGRGGRPDRGVADLGQRHALGQHLAQRVFGPGRDRLRPRLRRQQTCPARRVRVGAAGEVRPVDSSRTAEPFQGSIHPPETHVGPEQGKSDRRLQHQHVHQSGIWGVTLFRHGGIHAHNEHPCTAPGAAMGGSFPGIIVPAANQSSVPQSGNWCGQVSGFVDSERRLRSHVRLVPRLRRQQARPAGRVRVGRSGRVGRVRFAGPGLPAEPCQGSIHPAEAHVGPEQG